jgi:hypothetical protein
MQRAIDFAAAARRAHVVVDESFGHRNFSYTCPAPDRRQSGMRFRRIVIPL